MEGGGVDGVLSSGVDAVSRTAWGHRMRWHLLRIDNTASGLVDVLYSQKQYRPDDAVRSTIFDGLSIREITV